MPGLLRGSSSSSVGSFGSLGAKEEWEEGRGGENGRAEDGVELQIDEENICRSAHYGYVVRSLPPVALTRADRLFVVLPFRWSVE